MRTRPGVPAVLLVASLALALGACAGSGSTVSSTAKPSAKPSALAKPNVSNADGSIGALAPPEPGTYTYLQAGTVEVLDQGQGPEQRKARGTLRVTRNGEDVTTVRTEKTGSRIEQVLQYGTEGVFLVRQVQEQPVVNTTRTYQCVPKRPVLILPRGTGVGATWKDRVDCEAGQISYEAKAEASEPVRLGDGRSVTALRLGVHMTIAGTGLNSDSRLTLWFAPDLRLVVKQTEDTKAQLSVYDIVRKAEDVLDSGTPTA